VACHPDLTPGQRFESGYFQLLEGDLEMARKGKSTEEIVGFLREAEVRISQGETVGKICRSIGVSEQTYYKWRREYGGLKIDQARRLKDLERENDRLKRAVSELTLDKLILKEALSGKY
jgi:DNA-binding XRE family transcriptional regulator